MAARFSVILGAVAIVAWSIPAAAQPNEGVQLDYALAAGADTCPDASFFRDVVAGKLGGRDPFAATGNRRVSVAIRRGPRGFTATAALTQGSAAPSTRELADRDCTSLIETASLVVSAWLAPIVTPPATGPVFREPAATPVATPAPPVADRPQLRLDFGPHAAFTTLPGVGFGMAGGIGVRWPSFSISLEGRGDLAKSVGGLPVGQAARVGFASASAVPCLHVRWFLACGLLSGGAVSVSATGVTPAKRVGGYAGAGVRLGVEIPIVEHFALRFSGDVTIAVARPIAKVNAGEVWTLPPVGETLGGRAVVWF